MPFKSSYVTPPGLNITGFSPVKSTIVDSTPTLHSPPSIIASILPVISFTTCFAFVGLGFPERFALGAAIGTPAAFISFCAVSCNGKRIATVLSPAVTSLGTTDFFFKIIVTGPGIKLSITFFALSGISSAISFICHLSHICTISGLSDGLPFAA